MTEPFGPLLQRLLDERGWSHRRFASEVGTGQGFISQVIRGVRTPPLVQLDRWMAALDMPMAQRPAFREAALLAHAPEEVRHLVADLRQALAARRRVRRTTPPRT
jgi:transcriptional regulator with XRE-family HTH domain